MSKKAKDLEFLSSALISKEKEILDKYKDRLKKNQKLKGRFITNKE